MTIYRYATPDDEPFIISGWSASYRTSRDISFVPMARYADYMHGIIRDVLARPALRVIVAEGAVLRGFIAYEPEHVVYVYVAQPYRRQGFAWGLFAAAGIDPRKPFDYAARTKMSWELRGKVPLARYNPYRARYADEERP